MEFCLGVGEKAWAPDDVSCINSEIRKAAYHYRLDFTALVGTVSLFPTWTHKSRLPFSWTVMPVQKHDSDSGFPLKKNIAVIKRVSFIGLNGCTSLLQMRMKTWGE
jgi:hypothetical protein